jgi:hypothetical protein
LGFLLPGFPPSQVDSASNRAARATLRHRNDSRNDPQKTPWTSTATGHSRHRQRSRSRHMRDSAKPGDTGNTFRTAHDRITKNPHFYSSKRHPHVEPVKSDIGASWVPVNRIRCAYRSEIVIGESESRSQDAPCRLPCTANPRGDSAESGAACEHAPANALQRGRFSFTHRLGLRRESAADII